ncbi:MAG: hypothetical protein M0D57_10505 [Sphingobacteriales bacterium JAD_PAG50586_3]|nr:MAG: hypothetical protein M0D57_10505 [Sphingobacteriales bacterium JAD_PAG50586_3]
MKNFISISIVIIMLLIVGDVSSQTTKTWSGGTSTAWATAANWSPSGVPASTDHVVFNGTGTFQPTLDANRTVANITVTGNTVNLNSKILTVTGTTTLTGGTVNSGTISFTNTTTTFAGTTFGSKVKFSGGNVYFNGSTFNGVVDVVKGGAGTNNSTGGNTFNDSLKIKLTSNGTITMHSSTSNDAFNGHINISNVYCFTCITGYGSVYFGAVGGTGVGTLASGKTISIGSSGFAGATLGFIRFTQSGSTAQSITLTGSAVFKLGDKSGGTLAPTTWNGNLTVSSPNILIENSTFNGTATFSKTGTSSNVCNGNNTFNSTCTYNVNNSGYLTLANITGDTHNGASNFNRASSGLIYPAYNGDNYFYGNIAVGTNNGAVTLNNSGSGTINFNGSASQTLSKTGTGLITIKSMVMGKTSNSLTLNTPIQVSGTSAFNGGKIITTSTNLITYIDNATVSGASNASFVSGPAAKVGDDAFSFPTGKSSSYRPIDITSPSSASTVFTAQYFAANQSLGSTLDTGYVKISNCEYWTMTRSGSSNTVNVTLGWDNNSCNYAVPTKMRVVGWDGSKWKNYGNNTSTGTSTIGTVLSNTNPTSYTAFTLGNAGALEQPNVYEVWTTTAGTQNLFYKNITKVDGSFNTYVAGATVDSTGSYDMIVSKYNSSGVLSWTKQYNGAGNGNDMAADVLIDGSGNVYITGAAYVSAPNSYDLIVIKYNSGGTQQWVYTYNGGGSLYDGGISLRLSGSDLFVTGGAFNSSLNSDFATIKLSSSTGTQQWVNIWNSSWNKNDLPVKMDVGSGDTLLVTGMTQKTTNTYRIAALKLSKTSGSVLATNSYLTSDSTTMSTVTDIAEDDYHNIYVTGTISNGVSASSGVDFHTIKINYSDLHIAWQHSYSSDTTAEDQANSIDVDLNGNVYVSGYVTKNNQRDIAIIKYNSSGTLQWEQKYDQANGSDEGNAIIVDDLGTYIYTAGSIYSGSNTDYATMCYSSLGELKWIIAYNAPYVGNDQAFDITLDSLTNIYVSGQTQTGSSTSNYTTVKYGQLNLPLDVESTGTAGYINDQIIVKFRDGNLKMSAINNKGKLAGYIGDFINASTIDSLQAKLGTRLKHLPVFKVFTNMTEGDSLAINRQGDTIKVPKFWATLLLTLPSGYEEQTAIDSLNKLRNIVVFSQKNGVFMSTSSPNDPQYANQNSLESTTFTNADINIENAWNYETGKDYIKLAVIGSGYNGHTDLQRPNVNGGFTDILSGGKNFITGGQFLAHQIMMQVGMKHK